MRIGVRHAAFVLLVGAPGCAPGEVAPAGEADAAAATDASLPRDRALAMEVLAEDRATPTADARAVKDVPLAPSDVVARDVPAADVLAPRDVVSPRDLPPACVPTRTSCNMALECGAIPDGCPGGVLRCGECGGGETWCAIGASRWQTRVYNCVQRAQSEHPEWFDPSQFRDTSSWLVLAERASAYVAEVARCADGGDARAVVDGNAPGNEVRVRGNADTVAENFIVRTYGTGRTAGRYTSACTPAGF